MPLQAVIESAAFDALPDATVLGKDSFVKNEKENKFYLNLDGEEAGKLALPLQESVKKLETNNATLLDEKVKALQKLQPWEKLGKTADEIAELIKSGGPANAEELQKQFDTKLDSLTQSHTQALGAKDAEITAANERVKAIQNQLVGEMKRVAIAELKNKYDMNEISDDWLANRLQVVPEAEGSEKLVLRVFENGELAYKAGQLKTPEQLVEEARANKGLTGMFNGGTGGGGGSTNRQFQVGSTAGVIRVSREESKTNPQIYQKAKEEAAKTGARIEFTD